MLGARIVVQHRYMHNNMDLPPGNGPGTYHNLVNQPPMQTLNYLQVQQMKSLQQGQLQQMVLQNQNQKTQYYEQSQLVKPMQTQPLDFSQSSSPMNTAVLPIQNPQQTSRSASGQHITYIGPYSALTQSLIPE